MIKLASLDLGIAGSCHCVEHDIINFMDAEQSLDRKSRFPIRKFDSLEAMKDEEYRYWQGRPVSERIAAVSEITTEAYRLKDPACDVSRLQRTLVAVQRP
jgi:hypothetical protein